MKTGAVILAAGRGTRVGGDIAKQWRVLHGKSVAKRSMDAFASHPDINQLVLVLHPDDIQTDHWPRRPKAKVVTGGQTRQASVLAGLQALEGVVDQVLIHDAARPLVSATVIDRVITALSKSDAAAPALMVTDALWRGGDGLVTGSQNRAGLYRAQTPQGFRLSKILAAHRADQSPADDDVEVARRAGLDVAIVQGEEINLKITTEDDFTRAERMLDTNMDIRVGNGFDVHRFAPGDSVTLCGVTIDHSHTLSGHSDADVAMHALTDAIYGAIADGDIGQHFPPSDPQWRGADSKIFLEHAVKRARARGYSLSNADVTLICEEPKIGPHAQAMAASLATIIGVAPDRISVKATTSERLGFTGRGEGIAANATATLIKP
ncbi:MAG: bifunctional 2-C-methyl-D-erythritol 4-phosphate cytidylyltransferase/2-C-methyl-D-erythritol 2,4-cyclodiphosphate synthase [Paracoccaceae bacterium]